MPPTPTTQTPPSSPSRSMSHASTSAVYALQNAPPISERSASSCCRRSFSWTEASDGVVAHLASADPRHAFERHDPHLPIADLARAGGLGDGRGDALGFAVVGKNLDPHLGDEVDRVLGAS